MITVVKYIFIFNNKKPIPIQLGLKDGYAQGNITQIPKPVFPSSQYWIAKKLVNNSKALFDGKFKDSAFPFQKETRPLVEYFSMGR